MKNTKSNILKIRSQFKYRIERYLWDDDWLKFYIAGGSLRALSGEIQDIDIYCVNKTMLLKLSKAFKKEFKLIKETSKSETYELIYNKTDEIFATEKDLYVVKINLVKVVTGYPEDVVGTFDFVQNMNYLTWNDNKVCRRTTSKQLRFNLDIKTSSAILYRLTKMLKLGYEITPKEMSVCMGHMYGKTRHLKIINDKVCRG